MPFEVKLSRDRLEAFLHISNKEEKAPLTKENLSDLLKNENIVSGVNLELLRQIIDNLDSIIFPVLIARGQPKIDGKDAFLKNEVQINGLSGNEKFNFRNVLQIPSVKKGQLLATIIPAENGHNGVDVTGKVLLAKNGRPIRMTAGKNVEFNNGQFFATEDGQVSITSKAISVNPIFEVRGDLDLRTGNLDLEGNITIRGNVPSGYELKASGDIRIYGMVEAAKIEAGGNIIIEGGVAGAMKGSLNAGGNIQAFYLNQAIVKAGQDIIIKSSILHSKVVAGGDIDSRGATVIGGTLTAGRNIMVKELGNDLFVKTELAIGWDPAIEKAESDIFSSLESIHINIYKLQEIETRLMEVGKHQGKLTVDQLKMIQNQRATRQNYLEQEAKLKEELVIIHGEKQDKLFSTLKVFGKVFPNTKMYFGKYALLTNHHYDRVQFEFDQSEIKVHPLEFTENLSPIGK